MHTVKTINGRHYVMDGRGKAVGNGFINKLLAQNTCDRLNGKKVVYDALPSAEEQIRRF